MIFLGQGPQGTGILNTARCACLGFLGHKKKPAGVCVCESSMMTQQTVIFCPLETKASLAWLYAPVLINMLISKSYGFLLLLFF